MSELTRCFDRVFVINLPSRRDRYEEMGGQLRKAGLGWDSPQVTHFPAFRPADDGGFRSIGAHGCFRSHLGVIEQAIADGLDSILILEDDCNLSDEFGARMPEVNAALMKSDWSLFYGGYHLHGAPAPRADRGHPITRVDPEQPIWLAHCFAVRGAALRALPALLRAIMSRPAGDPAGGRMDVDGAYSWLRRLNPAFETYIATPEIAYQRSSRTDISEPTWRDRIPVVRELIAGARKLRNLRKR
jgi:glycosyl transferase, family 25